MRNDEAWWLDDSHPDAAAHRAFIEKYVNVPPAPRRRASANTAGYVTLAEVGRMLEEAGKTMAEELRKRDLKIKALEDRPPGLQYAGVFKPGASYPKHTGVSHQGSVWVARKDFPSKQPGEPNSGWILAVKRGRDGKDAK
jgi:hypothetical protein